MPRPAKTVILLALTAAAARLVTLQWLHPLQWDEIEFFRATDWVRQGLVPFRDFWEHHTPLQWFVFAPAAALTSSPGAGAIIWMRWAQLPLWIATFACALALMRRAELDPFARWSAVAVTLASTMFMSPAVEYRIDTLGCALFLAGLLFATRATDNQQPATSSLLAGICFCLAGLANLRLGPLLAATAVLLVFVDPGQRRWRFDLRRALTLGAGVAGTGALALLYFVATDSVQALYQQVWVENYLGDRYAEAIRYGFVHRVLVPFGVRIIGEQSFDPAGVDVGGILILVLGAAGLVLALRRWRTPDVLFVVAVLQLVSLAFIAKMKFVYHYHLEIVVVLMLPLVALAVSRIRRTEVVIALVAVAWCVNLFASVFRGKEDDRRYQDVIMREVHARTTEGAKVLDGIGWALRREPAYRFWFLPDLARQLVAHGHAPKYVLSDPPAAVIADHNLLLWLVSDRPLQQQLVRHYLPRWRNLWLPGLSARLTPEQPAFTWTVPADGDYRIYAAPALASHPWFARPLFVSTYHEADANRSQVRLGEPAYPETLRWSVAPQNGVLRLKKNQRLSVTSGAGMPLGLFLVPGDDRLLFRQPPPGVTIDASSPRVTHFPR